MLRSTLRPWRCLQNYGKARRPRSRVLVPSTQPAAPGPRPSPWGTGFPARPAWLKLTPVSLRRNHTLRTTCPCGLRRTLLGGRGQRCEFSPHFPVCLSVSPATPTSRPRRTSTCPSCASPKAAAGRRRCEHAKGTLRPAPLSPGPLPYETPTADDRVAQGQLERRKNKRSGELKA